MTNREKGLGYQKGFWWTAGMILLICGIFMLIIINKASGSIVPEPGAPIVIYLMSYGAIALGVLFFGLAMQSSAEAEQISQQPVRIIRARVHSIDTTQSLSTGVSTIEFKVASGAILRLYQEGGFTYIEGDEGQLTYKGSYVQEFDYEG